MLSLKNRVLNDNILRLFNPLNYATLLSSLPVVSAPAVNIIPAAIFPVVVQIAMVG